MVAHQFCRLGSPPPLYKPPIASQKPGSNRKNKIGYVLRRRLKRPNKPKRASMGRPYLRLEMTERRIPRVKRARERTELKNPLLVQKIALVVQKLALRSI